MSLNEKKKNGVKSLQTIRILAVADVVQPQLYNPHVKDWLPPVDLILSCGDLPPEYLDFLASMLGVPMAHVLGNHCDVPHDASSQRCHRDAYQGAFNLDGHVAEFEGLILAGLEGSPFYNRGPHQYTESQVSYKLFRLVPALLREKLLTGRYLDIMVTHAPPRGIHDYDDVPHRGFESLLWFLERFRPALMLHGHSHRYDPLKPMYTRYKGTDIVNVYGHAIIELERGNEQAHWSVRSMLTAEGRHGKHKPTGRAHSAG
jgi:hypothetical protein